MFFPQTNNLGYHENKKEKMLEHFIENWSESVQAKFLHLPFFRKFCNSLANSRFDVP